MFSYQTKQKEHIGIRVQPKLKIGQPGDKYEQEADAVADRVMSMNQSETMQMQPIEEDGKMLHTKIPMKEEEEDESIQMKCDECEGDEIMQMNSNYYTGYSPDEIEHSIEATKGNGSSLSPKINMSMSKTFGQDFNAVKVHRDNVAIELNERLNARAFTYGSDIYFNKGEYNPSSSSGKRLLTHELTHVVQQGQVPLMIQGDFMVDPTTPNTRERTLTAVQIQNAISFNQARHTDVNEISLMRDILGVAKLPAIIDEDFVNAVASYQSQYGLIQDGQLGHDTADRLAKEIIGEGDFLGVGRLGSLAPEFQLITDIRALIDADNRNYADYKNTIQASTFVQGHVALNNQQLLTDLKTKLSWNNWARSIELLGRQVPSGEVMRTNMTVRAAMRLAWAASNPTLTRWPTPDVGSPLAGQCNPIMGAPAVNAHEEGGFVYLNLITGDLTTRRVAAGGQAALPLSNPVNVTNSVVVGGFHTHPNVGVCWGAPFFSGADTNWSTNNGVPILMIGAFPAIANTSFHASGTARRHLAGDRGLPGAVGGLAPQAKKDESYDEL